MLMLKFCVQRTWIASDAGAGAGEARALRQKSGPVGAISERVSCTNRSGPVRATGAGAVDAEPALL